MKSTAARLGITTPIISADQARELHYKDEVEKLLEEAQDAIVNKSKKVTNADYDWYYEIVLSSNGWNNKDRRPWQLSSYKESLNGPN